MELNREQVVKDLQKIVDNYSGSWQRFNVLNNALTLIKELTDENEVFRRELKDYFKNAWTRESDLVHKMQSMIKEECIAGGIWPAFVARVVENVGKKLLEGKNDV